MQLIKPNPERSIFDLMKGNHIARIQFSYSGGGDSGAFDSTEAYDQTQTEIHLSHKEIDTIENFVYSNVDPNFNDGGSSGEGSFYFENETLICHVNHSDHWDETSHFKTLSLVNPEDEEHEPCPKYILQKLTGMVLLNVHKLYGQFEDGIIDEFYCDNSDHDGLVSMWKADFEKWLNIDFFNKHYSEDYGYFTIYFDSGTSTWVMELSQEEQKQSDEVFAITVYDPEELETSLTPERQAA